MIHRGFFSEVFRQLKTAGIVMACVLMLFNVGTFFTNMTALLSNQLNAVPSDTENALYMILFIYIAGLVLTFIAFNWLNRRFTSDFYHALPIRRAQMYWSTFLAIVLWIVIGITGYAVVHALLYLITGMPFNYLSFLCVYLNMLIGIIQTVGVVSLACALSGTRFVNLFSAAVILLLPRALLLVLAGFIYAEAGYLEVLRFPVLFDPSYNIFGTPYMSVFGGMVSLLGGSTDALVRFTDPVATVYSLAHACLLAFLGMVAFRRRPSEAAGMPMRSRVLQGVVRTAFGLPLLLIVVLLVHENTFSLSAAVILTLFAFTFYCLYELISTKSAKRMLRAMPLFSICIGIAVLYLFVPKLIAKAASSVKVPEDSIASVSFEDVFYSAQGNTYEAYCQKQVRIDDPEVRVVVANAYRRTLESESDFSATTVSVRIYRNNGCSLLRSLQFTAEEYAALLDAANRDTDYQAKVRAFPKGVHYVQASGLTAAQAHEIGALFAEEFAALSDADRETVKTLSIRGGDYRTKILYYLQLRGVLGVDSYNNRYAITELTPKTAQRYTELLYETYDEHAKDRLRELRKWMDSGDGYPSACNLGTVQTVDPYQAYYNRFDKPHGLPKQVIPEYVEVLDLLLNAEPAQNTDEGVTVIFDTGYSYNSFLTNDLSGSVRYLTLKLTDEQLQRIRELIGKYDVREFSDEYSFDEYGVPYIGL